MIRFTDALEQPVNLDYHGVIWAVDDLNCLVAICPDNPSLWEDWSIFNHTEDEVILQRALASAWSTLALATRIHIDRSNCG